jgi:hypothetical protein
MTKKPDRHAKAEVKAEKAEAAEAAHAAELKAEADELDAAHAAEAADPVENPPDLPPEPAALPDPKPGLPPGYSWDSSSGRLKKHAT